MKRILKVLTVFSVLVTLFSGCDNFLNSSEDFRDLMQTEIDYAKAPLVNVLVGHNNDDFGTVGTGVVNYSITAKVGYAFEASFSLKSTAGNFVGWNAYTKYDPDVPSNCIPLDESCIEFLDDSRGKTTTKVKVLKKIDGQIRLVPEVSAFPVMELLLPSELIGITPVPASFNPPQSIKALTPGQEYSITATTTVDYGFSENSEECWKVYRKDSLGNEIEIPNGDKISITKNPGSQLANGRSQSSIFITVDPDFSGRFYVSPKLITYPSMKVEVDNAYSSLVKMSHSGTVSMAKGAPYSITLQTDPSVGFKGWKLCKKDNNTFAEIAELIPADNKTTTNLGAFTPYQDTYINVSAPSYEVTETGKSAGRVNASIVVTLKEDMSDLNFSYYLIPQFFDYPVVNIKTPDNYASAGQFSLNGPGYIDNDSVRMMMDDYEYTITYKTTADYSFAETYWLVYEETDPSKNLLEENDARIEITKSSIVTDESGVSTCSVSVILKHNFGNTLNIKPIVAQKPGMNIAFADGTPNGISLSLGGTTITSGNVNKKEIKMTTGKTYTATVNVPKGYSFEGWRLVRENSSNNTLNWITESTKSTSELVDSADLAFDAAASSERPENYIRLFNAKYDFQNDGRNAGTTRATVDILFKKELSQFSLNLIPVIKAVPEISFAAVNSDYGTLTPATSDVRNLYTESKIDLSFKSTNQATVGTQIWKIKKWDPTTNAYSIDYSANVGYTNLDLTAALNNAALSAKDIIIYNNDKEPEVQPNSRGEYITTKTAVLYVNKMPDANLQLSVEPEVLPSFYVKTSTEEGSTSPSEKKSVFMGIDFNISYISTSGYGFNKWSAKENGVDVPVLTLDEANSTPGASATSFVVDLGSVQELTESNSLSNIQTALGSNSSKLLAVIYNSSKVESQATEGVETATAKFRIVKDVASTIVVSPVTYKHSYLYLHLSNSTYGRFSPVGRTLLKAGKDYDFEYIFNGEVYSVGNFSLSSDSSFARGTSFVDTDFTQITDSSISDWSTYSSKKFVIYGISDSVNENNNVATSKAKIRLIKELPAGIEIHIRPSVFDVQKVTFTADTNDISKLQINNTISTTGSIDAYPIIDHTLLPYKSYSISATPVSGKAIYGEPAKMWKIVDEDGNDLDEVYDCAEFTEDSFSDDLIKNYDIVFYNCRLEYAGNNLYKACADIIVKRDKINGNFKILPNVYSLPVFDFAPPVTAVGNEKKGTCYLEGVVTQSNTKLLVGQTYRFTYEAAEGYHISTFGLYDNSGVLKSSFNKTTGSYIDNAKIKISDVTFTTDMTSVEGNITILSETANGFSFKCNVLQGKAGPTLILGGAYSYTQYKEIKYTDTVSSQSNTEVSSLKVILNSQEFSLETAQARGYQGVIKSDNTPGYPIAKPDSIRFTVYASDTQYQDGKHTPSKVKITERLFYIHPGMIFDSSTDHNFSEFEVIPEGGLQLFDEDGIFIADNKYKNAAFNLEETTIINATSLTNYNKPSTYAIKGNTSYSNKIPYGGIHQYTVSALDDEGNESNKFVLYFDVPRTPMTSDFKNLYWPAKSSNQRLYDNGYIIEWPADDYPENTKPLNNNRRLVYEAGSYKSSTIECKIEKNTDGTFRKYVTPLSYFPLNSTFNYKIYITDSNGYASEKQESIEFTSPKVHNGDLVVRDSRTFKLYYITLELYEKNKDILEPMSIIVNFYGVYGDLNNRIIGAGLYDVGDYPFANLIVYTNKWWGSTGNTVSFDGRTKFETWKNHPEYYGTANGTYGDVLFIEPNFPALFSAKHYGDIYKTKSGVLSSGWYLPGSDEMAAIRVRSMLDNINSTLKAIDAQPFEYDSGYWCAEFASADRDGPRNLIIKTPKETSTSETPTSSDFARPMDIHHVRAVFDFTDIAEPWPYN